MQTLVRVIKKQKFEFLLQSLVHWALGDRIGRWALELALQCKNWDPRFWFNAMDSGQWTVDS